MSVYKLRRQRSMCVGEKITMIKEILTLIFFHSQIITWVVVMLNWLPPPLHTVTVEQI